MSQELLAAILSAGARLGFDTVAAFLERTGKPGATIEDAIAACKAASTKTLADFKRESASPPAP